MSFEYQKGTEFQGEKGGKIKERSICKCSFSDEIGKSRKINFALLMSIMEKF